MITISEYLLSKTKTKPVLTKATNETIKEIVAKELKTQGNKANLNHIDVSEVTNFNALFKGTDFQGDVSQWDMSNAENTEYMFEECNNFNCDISSWSLDNIKNARSMFYDCISLITAPKLPATTLVKFCYATMFYRCTSLCEAPELPATKLTEWCYYEMFSDCKSLKEAPELPATELDYHCYGGMFAGCSSLKYFSIPKANNWKDRYYSADMLIGTPLENKF